MVKKTPKTQENSRKDSLGLKMYVGKFFGVGKLKMNSEIQNIIILTPFVTSQTPKMTQNGQ